ncbi:hypothetical protein LRS37_12825 [Neobacillus sedimentimangrovi]|uniref:Phage head-tail adapter protein n=1 Tax=Neobacillus sedimentimangrovi TaxID=2699460 RepID=A0ABS8QKM7_9BACI|nr:hypothetical protein [Neobacillus sedimentimangrovi]MCD4839733.1 hypothetical protein [Neobacillus sedimentimangrovi]
MKFDKQMDIVSEEKVSDGMGGYEVIKVVIGSIQAFTTPVKAEIMLKEHGIVSTTALKVFTKDTLPNEFVQLRYGETMYKILQLADFGKLRMLLVEVIPNG